MYFTISIFFEIKVYEFFATGRILNRFSKDIGQVDDLLPMNFYDVLNVSMAKTVLFSISIYSLNIYWEIF